MKKKKKKKKKIGRKSKKKRVSYFDIYIVAFVFLLQLAPKLPGKS